MEIKKNFNISNPPSSLDASSKLLIIRDLLSHRFSIIQQNDEQKASAEEQLNLLKQNYESLMAIYSECKKELPSILRHYIEQQSFVKAHEFIRDATGAQNS